MEPKPEISVAYYLTYLKIYWDNWKEYLKIQAKQYPF